MTTDAEVNVDEVENLKATIAALEAEIARLKNVPAITTMTWPTRLTDPDPSLVEAVTRVMRAADRKHLTEGGSTRHYVRDLLLPMLEDAGIEVRESRARAGSERETEPDRILAHMLDRAREEGRRAGIEKAAALLRQESEREARQGKATKARRLLVIEHAVRALARGGNER